MFYNLRDKLNRRRFDFKLRKSLKIKPLQSFANNGVAIITLLQSKDVIMYLLAIASFINHVKVEKIFILNDGSLGEPEINKIRNVIPDVVFLNIEDYMYPEFPRNGCWERILAISDLVNEYYVVQLDADTLTIGNIDEIINCIHDGIAFTLGTYANQEILPITRRDYFKKHDERYKDHVQIVSESNFDKLTNYNSLRYTRGCAGFSGFPKKSFDNSFIREISKEMFSIIGDKWKEWGSEQVMSNIVVSNISRAMALPFPKYCSVDSLQNNTAFVHFIGSYRFGKGIYARLGQTLL